MLARQSLERCVVAAARIVTGNDCVRLNAGGLGLFARTIGSGNGLGGLALEGTFGFGLTNASGALQIGVDGVTLDTVTWATASSAKSFMIDTDGTQCIAPAGVPLYNGTDTGSPRANNTQPECP
jgi:hypothetical protein